MADTLKGYSYDLNCFDALPERAKVLFFYCLDTYDWFQDFLKICSHEYENCKSPMEILFNYAFDIVSFQVSAKEIVYLEPQVKITTKEGKKYFADFEIRIQKLDEERCTKILIEVDGHDFHEKTKKQVAYDKERELEIKMEGYDIIRFSGSQVWNDPLKCATSVFEYIEKKGIEYGK